MNNFKIYEDKELKIPVGEELNLGKLKAGTKKKYKFYIYNGSVNPFEELSFSVENKEVKIVEAPDELQEKSNAEIILEWSPSVDVRQGLKTRLKIEGYEVLS